MSEERGNLKYSELVKLFDSCNYDEVFTKAMPQYPDECLITGYRKCEDYYFDEGVVYLPEPAYDAYTLPAYDSDEQCFISIKIDMDEDFVRENVLLCELVVLCKLIDVLERSNFKQIKEFYDIPNEDIEWARKELKKEVFNGVRR